MTQRDDAKRLRIRDDSIESDLSRSLRAAGTGVPSLVARTTKLTTYPTTAKSFFACAPVAVLGRETEGGAADLTVLSATFLALNLGGSIPPQGTDIVTTFVGNRWVFRYDA